MEDEPFEFNLSDQEIFDLINDKNIWSDQMTADQQVIILDRFIDGTFLMLIKCGEP